MSKIAIKDLVKDSPVRLERLEKESRETRPPNRFTESSLVSKLDELGIARPSTVSSIISLIQDRGYVAKKGNQLYPTPLGFAVARLLKNKLPDFTDYAYTSNMES